MGISEIEYEKLLLGKSGIYMWTSPSGKKYVGLSYNLGSRHKDFRCASDNRTYASTNSIIDKARKKYPYDQWHYEVLEFCPIDLLGEREKYWIAYYKTNDNKYGYNITDGGRGGNGVPKTAFKPGHKTTEEQKKKAKETLHKHIQEGSVSYDYRGLKVAIYDLQGNFIKDFTTIKKAEKWCGCSLSWAIKHPDSNHAADKKYMVRTSKQFDIFPSKVEPFHKIKRTLSDEAKHKISIKLTGKTLPSCWTKVVALNRNGEFYKQFDSIDIAAEYIHPDNPKSAAKNISRVINGKGGFDKYGNYHVKKTAYNFIWKKLSDDEKIKVVSDGVA